MFLYVTCSALRLAKFNAQTKEDPDQFSGIPTPVAAPEIREGSSAFQTFVREHDHIELGCFL